MGKLRHTHVDRFDSTTMLAGAGSEGNSSPPSVQDRTVAVARGISMILKHHDCPPALVRECLDQMTDYLNTASDERIWVKRVKNFSARPLALYLKNELPPDSDQVFRPKGSFRKWFRNRINAYNDRNTHLWYSWFQGKRCCLPSSEDFIKETYKEHLESLTAPDPGDDFAIDAAFANPVFERLLEELRDGLDRYMETEESGYQATQSACFEGTRSHGGQFHYLKVLGGLRNHPPQSIFEYWDLIPHTSELSWIQYVCHPYGGKNLIQVRQPSGFEDWQDLNSAIKEIDWSCPLSCEIKGVIEPLKVRVISKGEALPYFSQRKLQRALHDQMRKISCFRLIGRPFSPTDLMDLKKNSRPGDHWFSVDYSAATDGLSWKFSSMILRKLLQNRPETELLSALRVLGPHELHYPQWDEKKNRFTKRAWEGTQVNGQLMGSILSFPILCLANLATYLLTMSGDHYEMGLDYDQVLEGVLVNGDDMVYPARPELWDRHIKVSHDLGLKMSVGKAYRHPYYANINSTSITYRLDRECTPREIPYLNVGLFFQEPVQKKETEDKKQARSERDQARRASGLASSHHEEEGVVACVTKLLSGCLNRKKGIDTLKEYLARHEKVISEETRAYIQCGKWKSPFTRNLFTHPSVGGMGIVPPPGWRFRIKTIEKIVAANLMSSCPTTVCFDQPLSGFPVLEAEEESKVPWVKPQRVPDYPVYIINNFKNKCRRSILHTGFFPVSERRNSFITREEMNKSTFYPLSFVGSDEMVELVFRDQFPAEYEVMLKDLADIGLW